MTNKNNISELLEITCFSNPLILIIFYLEMNGKSISNHLEYLFNYIKNKFDLWNHVEKRIVFHTICETFFLCQTNTEIQEKELKKLFTDFTVPFEIPESEVQDIDNEEDWKVAEIKYQLIHKV